MLVIAVITEAETKIANIGDHSREQKQGWLEHSFNYVAIGLIQWKSSENCATVFILILMKVDTPNRRI